MTDEKATGSPEKPQKSPSAPAAVSKPVPAPEPAPESTEKVTDFSPVLVWIGDESKAMTEFPARNLAQPDLQRLVFIRTGLKPESGDYTSAYDDLVSMLGATGLYSKE